MWYKSEELINIVSNSTSNSNSNIVGKESSHHRGAADSKKFLSS